MDKHKDLAELNRLLKRNLEYDLDVDGASEFGKLAELLKDEEMVAFLIRKSSHGARSILSELELECRLRLAEYDDPPDVDKAPNALTLAQDALRLVDTDAHGLIVCHLLYEILYLGSQGDTLSQDDFGREMFQIGVLAEQAKFETVRKFAESGHIRRRMLVEANKSESRKEAKEQRHQNVLAEALQLVARGCERREVAGVLAMRYNSEGIKPASDRHIRRILKENNFYK